MPQQPTVNPSQPDRTSLPSGEERVVAGTHDVRSLVEEVPFDAASEAYAHGFAQWVEERRAQMSSRWGALVAQRIGRVHEPLDPLLTRFFDLTLTLLPACLGPYRSQFVPLFRSLAELYGRVGAARGLAAGEIIEEVQLLREVLIRRLFSEPPEVQRAPVLLREILRLNRMVDRGVTFASVGHTDAMFFSLFQGSGAPKQLTADVRSEISEQFDDIQRETKELLTILSRQ